MQPEVEVSNTLHSTIDSVKNVFESISSLADNSELLRAVTRALGIPNSMNDPANLW